MHWKGVLCSTSTKKLDKQMHNIHTSWIINFIINFFQLLTHILCTIGRAILKYAKTSIFLVLMTSQYIVQFNYLFPLEIQVQSCSTLWSLCQGFCSYFSSQRWVIDLCRDLFCFLMHFFKMENITEDTKRIR